MALAVLGGLSASVVVGIVLDTGVLLGRKAVFQHLIKSAYAVVRQLDEDIKDANRDIPLMRRTLYPDLVNLNLLRELKSRKAYNLDTKFSDSRSRDLKLIPIICGIAVAILSIPFTSFSFALACGVTAAASAFTFNLGLVPYESELVYFD